MDEASRVNSRVKVLEKPINSPGKCAMCGAVNRPVVDIGLDINGARGNYGTVYFCFDCITEIGMAVGLVSEEDVVASEEKEAEVVNNFLDRTERVVVDWEVINDVRNTISYLTDLSPRLTDFVEIIEITTEESSDIAYASDDGEYRSGFEDLDIEPRNDRPVESASFENAELIGSEGPISFPTDTSNGKSVFGF